MDNSLRNKPDDQLTWQEHIRKRPGMYLGIVNHKGFVDTLKRMITHIVTISGSNSVNIDFGYNSECRIEFNNIKHALPVNISVLDTQNMNASMDLAVLNATSDWMTLSFASSTNTDQHFVRGVPEKYQDGSKMECQRLIVHFALDEIIWGRDFQWNVVYLSHEIREFSFLNSNIKFFISEKNAQNANYNTYLFTNGLSDRLDIEILNGLGTCYFKHHILLNNDAFELEAAFAFRQYTVDQTFIKTYVNKECTPENGSHLDGLLKGLTYGVMQYFQENDLVAEYKISEKAMKNGLVCLLNIDMEEPIYSGCVKNKLASPEIIEPISEYVATTFYNSILEDVESTNRIIDKFKI